MTFNASNVHARILPSQVVECVGWGNREHATRTLTDGLLPSIQTQEDLNTYPLEYTAISLLARRV
jgi:hypothetical protein